MENENLDADLEAFHKYCNDYYGETIDSYELLARYRPKTILGWIRAGSRPCCLAVCLSIRLPVALSYHAPLELRTLLAGAHECAHGQLAVHARRPVGKVRLRGARFEILGALRHGNAHFRPSGRGGHATCQQGNYGNKS